MAFYQTIRGSAVTIPTPRETGWGQNVDNAISYLIDVANTGTLGVSIGGNTLGTKTIVSSGAAILMGGNNITLSQNGQNITIQGAAAGTGGGISGISAGSTLGSSGTVQFSNSNGLAFGMDGQTITGSYTQSTHDHVTYLGGVAAGGATQTAGTVILSNSNGLAFSLNGSTITGSYSQSTAPAAIIIGSNTSGATASISSGTMLLAGGNNITLSQNGQSITISGANVGGAQTGISGIAQSQTTYSSGTVIFSEQANVTINSSVNGASQYIRISCPASHAQQTGVSGIGGSNTTYTSGTVILSGQNNITIGSSLDGASQYIRISAPNAQTGVSGLANSQTTYTSGTIIISDQANVTINSSVNGVSQYIRISCPATHAQQTGISGIGGSDSTYSSGTIIFSGQNNLTVGTSVNGASQYIRLSVPSQSTQTQNCVDLAISGNTSGALATINSGTAVIFGGNNVTLSQNGQSITISGANLGGAQTGISGIGVSDTTYSSGTVIFSAQANVTLGKSVDGVSQYVRISAGGGGGNLTISASSTSMSSGSLVFSNSNGLAFGLSGSTITGSYSQSTHSHGAISLSGNNTSGILTAVSSGTLYLAGGNNITLSQNGQSITFSGANVGGAQTGISGLGNSASTFTSGTVLLSEQANVTINTSVDGASIQYLRISCPATHAQQTGISGVAGSNASTLTSGTVIFGNSNSFSFGLTSNSITASFSESTHSHSTSPAAIIIGSNTSGATASISSGTLMLAGGNNITLSQNGQSITISGPNVGGAQTGISGIADSANTVTVGTVFFGNGGNISFGLNSVTMTGSFSQSTHSHVTYLGGVGGSNTTYTSGTVVLTGSNMVTVKSAAGQLVFDATQSIQTQSTMQLNGSTASVTIVAGAYMQVSNTSSSISLINLLSTSSMAQPISAISSAGTKSSVFAMVDHVHAGVAVAGVSAGNTAGDASGTRYGSFMLAGGNNVTLSLSTAASGQTITISAFNQSVQTQSTFSMHGTSGSVTLVAGNLMSVSNNASTISIINLLTSSSYAAPVSSLSSAGTKSSNFALVDHIHQGIGAAGVSGGNTAGNSSGTYYGSLMLAGGNSITLSVSTAAGGQTITISGPSAVASVPQISISGSTSGTAALISSGTLSLAGGSNIFLSQSNDNHLSIVLYSGPTVKRINAEFIATTLSANNQSIELSQGFNWYVHLSSNATITSMANPRDGERYFFWISNRSTFNTLSFPSVVKWRNASAYVPTGTAGAIDAVCLMYNSSAGSYIAEHASSFA
jgi:fibronectin-binding autotransporter adhesin